MRPATISLAVLIGLSACSASASGNEAFVSDEAAVLKPLPAAATAAGSAVPTKSTDGKPLLYGRLEQLDNAQTPSLPNGLLKTEGDANNPDPGGKLEPQLGSYPEIFTGTWGGHLTLLSYKVYPAYHEMDAKAADHLEQTAADIKEGTINFRFRNEDNRISLVPTYCLFITHVIPGASFGPNVHIRAPVEVGFSGGCLAGRGPAGTRYEGTILRDEIKKVSDSALEEDTFIRIREWNSTTKVEEECVSEGLLHFEQIADDKLRVTGKRLRFTADGKPLWAMSLEGIVTRGVVVHEPLPF
ncbi:MAG TPA: hypothetical protein V6C72_01020 [Chroococcales cyanobacterium]